MPVRLARPAGGLFARPPYRAFPPAALAPTAPGAAQPAVASRRTYSSSSSAGRSDSRDGTPRVKQQPAAAPSTPAPQLAHALKAGSHPPVKSPKRELKRAFELPHVRSGVVGLDAFFAGPRPLLELPIPLGTRRSTLSTLTDSTHVPRSVADVFAKVEDELVQVVDQAEDGTPVGEPYLARLKPADTLRSVEEELAAEAQEEAEFVMQEEIEHQKEAAEAEPYDAWLLGQHEVQPSHVARYLASRPDLAYLTPFSSSTSATPSTDYSRIFSAYFVDPLKPSEAGAVADRFLAHVDFQHGWQARKDFVATAAERLRQAEAHFSGDKAAPATFVAEEDLAAKAGTIRVWREQDGWVQLPVAIGSGENPFLPAEIVDLDVASEGQITLDSVKRKRRTKMKKHKYKKRRKAQRALRQRLGK
ncbi:hypothetical protein Rhopal_000464-T1 [Rhodotorula paludigena]|uniref:Small ribosomal subunit protein mS38 n=1 Tax=Rhodotorula paludigena TaxID=86838 RepID=A0AAV5GDT8_9BASI|nr:hypothetical protein Rhopal_000464-T1 [Rhodotorula paludigena]